MRTLHGKIDLHAHTTASDGRLSPKGLVDLAIRKKIAAIAITDHNTAAGNRAAMEYARGKKIEVVPGIEITITPPREGVEVHMVGLFINPDNKEILDIPKLHRVYAEKVTRKMIEKLNKLGYKISFNEFLNETAGRHLGRPFMARILMRKYPEEFPDSKDVFDKLLGSQGKAFVKPVGTSMKRAIEVIHNAGGVAILAHPWFLRNEMENIVRQFSNLGGDGIEFDYTPRKSIARDMKRRMMNVLREKSLIIAGGTDFHELYADSDKLGERGLTVSQFERLKKYHARVNQR